MSIPVLNWAWGQPGLDPSSKLVLLSLADHANDDGESWPSLERLSERTGRDRRTVQRAVAALEARGLVEREPAKGVRSTRYRLLVQGRHDTTPTGGTTPPLADEPEVAPRRLRGGTTPPGGRHHATSRDGTTPPEPSEPSTEPSGNPHASLAPLAQAPTTRPRNELWDALVACFGNVTTAPERSNRGKVVRELTTIGATADDVHARVVEHSRRGNSWQLTANALLTHWTELDPQSTTPPLRAQTPREQRQGLWRVLHEHAATDPNRPPVGSLFESIFTPRSNGPAAIETTGREDDA